MTKPKQKIQEEAEAFRSTHTELAKQYLGQVVAVHEGQACFKDNLGCFWVCPDIVFCDWRNVAITLTSASHDDTFFNFAHV